MRIKYLYIKLLLIYILSSVVHSSEIEFESEDLKIKNDGKLIFAVNSKTQIQSENLEIISKNVEYNKETNILKFFNDVVFIDLKNNLKIESNEIIYKRNNNLIFSSGATKFDVKNKYKITSSNVFYDRIKKQIYANDKADIIDEEKNIYKLEDRYNLDIEKEIIKSKKSVVIDNKKNKYIFEDLAINLKNNEIAGNELKIEFEDSYFGNKKNDPILRGRSAYSNKDELNIQKAVFSTCNIANKECRGWELNSEKFTHNKKKKIFEYKNSWLKIFDIKLLYFPYFNHPDPSVKRKSGFLTPSYKTSENLGTSIKFPYFKVLGSDKDITFSPRYFADKSFLLQNEYRQILKQSKVLSDFGFLVGEAGTKGHLFYNLVGRYNDVTSYELNLQSVKGDNYLKNHDLKDNSLLIDNENLLISDFNINWNFEDSQLNSSFKVFEDLSRNYHDRYQYIFPEYSFKKNIEIPENYNGKFNFDTYGYNKNYNTNINESVLVNNFHFKSNDIISSSGLVTNYDLLIKNANSYSEKSGIFKKNENYELFETFILENNLPLIRKDELYTYYLIPKTSLRYSPNGSSDLSSKDLVLNYNNVFSLDRISTNYQVESGEALTLGLEFQKNDNKLGNIINFRVANVVKPNKEYKLPSKSKLNQTRSDIFGDLNLRINNHMNLGYTFSYDRDLDYSNLDAISLNFNVNNFITKFKYYSENHDFGDEENIKNSTSFKFDSENSIKFNTSKDLKDDFTEYYNLAYEYLTDCISVNFNFNKTFYSDGNLEPDKTLSFLIKIIPFTEIGVANISSMIVN